MLLYSSDKVSDFWTGVEGWFISHLPVVPRARNPIPVAIFPNESAELKPSCQPLRKPISLLITPNGKDKRDVILRIFPEITTTIRWG